MKTDAGDVSRAAFLWGDCQAVVKSDATAYDPPLLGLYVGGAGDVAVTTPRGSVVTFVGVAAGTFLPVLATKVMSTNTSATNIVGGKP